MIGHTTLEIMPSRRVQFGVFEVDLQAEELRRSGVRVRLQSQPFKVLTTLLEHPGEVVSRETLQHQLWGNDTTVDFDHGLGIAVNKLRDALGDSAENPRFVETLARKGYRFIAPVRPMELAGGLSAFATAEPHTVPRSSALAWSVAGIAILGCLALALLMGLRPIARTPYRVSQVTFSGRVLTNDLDVASFSSSATDGTRIYYSQLENGEPTIAVALAANGEVSHLHLPSAIIAPLVASLSADGSRLVVHSHLQSEPEQPLWIVPTLGGDAQRVPNVLAHDATWMPDGVHLLVASGNNLVVVGTDGTEVRKFATVPGLAYWLRWSPDGSVMRFTVHDPGSQTTKLWEIRADGSHLHPLLPDWDPQGSDCCGSWTPDGDYFVFESSHGGHGNIWMRTERPWFRRSSTPTPITQGPLDYSAPITAPNSNHVYFIGSTSQFELLQAEPKSATFTSLGPDLSAASLAQYSPDGKWVAWLNGSDNSLWCGRTDGTEHIELSNNFIRIFTMKWSPNDRRLAVMAEEPGKPWKIYIVDADGGKMTPILNDDRNEGDPSWTPDGQSIVFGRLPERMDSGNPKAIYILNLATHQVTQIPGSEGLFSPRLSPDGRYLAAMPLDQHSMRLLDRTTAQWTVLTTHSVGDPTWSHDGHFIYFQDFIENNKPLYRIPVPTGNAERIATIENLRPFVATDYRLIGLAPGDLPVVTARTPVVNLYRVDLDAHADRKTP